MPSFQVKLGGHWQDYSKEEDQILKRAFLAGFPNAKFELRGQKYEYSFKNMKQKNMDSGKERDIRAPFRWKPPSKPVVAVGPTTSITIPTGSPGTKISIPHPKDPRWSILVDVPRTGKPGQSMLVPVPEPGAPGTVQTEKVEEEVAKKGGSVGKKMAIGTAGVVALGGVAVAGGVLGMYAAEHGIDATGDMLADGASGAVDAIGDGLGDAGEYVGELADAAAPALEDAGDFALDAADSAGDFIMDLF